MSAQDADTESETDDDGPGRREVAHRVFAAEYDDATLSHTEGEEERAPTYVVTPSGAKANRLFLSGVLTEVEQVNDEMLRARIVDPTGAFVVYAGQYQPEARATFDRTDPPEFVAVAGKARTFQPEDGDRVFSSVRPESVNVVDADTRDRWVVETARATLRRVGEMATALRDGAPTDPTDGVRLALDHYHTTGGYLAALRDLATDAAAVVADRRDEVRPLDAAPDDDGPADLDALAALRETEGVAGDTPPPTVEREANDAGPEAETETDRLADEADAGSGAEAAGDVEEIDTGETVASFDDDVGDFEPGDLEADAEADAETATDPGSEAAADADGEMYELDDEERERIESEYGTEFSTGTEVEDPGEADIETPAPEADAETETGESVGAEADAEAETMDDDEAESVDEEVDAEAETTDEEVEGDDADAEPTDDEAQTADEEVEEETAGDVDAVLMERMREMDDGDGADRADLVAAVADATGADVDAVEDAIQDALMSGQCYEPADDRLKPI